MGDREKMRQEKEKEERESLKRELSDKYREGTRDKCKTGRKLMFHWERIFEFSDKRWNNPSILVRINTVGRQFKYKRKIWQILNENFKIHNISDDDTSFCIWYIREDHSALFYIDLSPNKT